MRKLIRWIVTPRYHVPLWDVFWRSLLTATLLPLAVWLAASAETPPNDPTQALRVSATATDVLDYRTGHWWVNDRMVMLDCPAEESCQMQWTGEHWWIYKVAS